MEKKYYCNPINIDYKYQFNLDQRKGGMRICREAADPSAIFFNGKYYIFASMNLSVWVSDDLANWTSHKLPDNLPLYDYAPDVRVIDDYVYFCASKRGETCSFFKTKDVVNGPYEEIKSNMEFWDPHLFEDDDKRLYFYWGCTNTEPIWGVELDRKTMKPICEKVGLIEGKPFEIGYERVGDNHSLYPRSNEEIEMAFNHFLNSQNMTKESLPPHYIPLIKGMFSNKPFIEGPWMNKINGTYYLQYAAPGTQYNGYSDGVYISNSPLGPFTLAKNNPFSYKPTGFINGAGHGSTFYDENNNLWHTSTGRISINHDFERRVCLWPAGMDEDGELFCNQSYGDWPRAITNGKMDPHQNPEWFLLSYKKPTKVSSVDDGYSKEHLVDENIQTFWKANEKKATVQIDLEEISTVNAVQINFADDKIDIEVPGKIRGTTQARYIEERNLKTRWILEGSIDGINYITLEDKSNVDTDLPHDLIVIEEGKKLRFIKLTILEVPYNQNPCMSAIRIFGKGNKDLPNEADFTLKRLNDLDAKVTIEGNSIGYNVLWGEREDKLYHSALSYDNEIEIKALVKGEEYYFRVDSFNETGITKGFVKKLE